MLNAQGSSVWYAYVSGAKRLRFAPQLALSFLFLICLAAPASVRAASLFWGYYDGTQPTQIELLDGGTYEVPLNVSAPGYFAGDFSFFVNAYLYRIAADGSREPVAFLLQDFPRSFAWPAAGQYELEINEAPLLVLRHTLERFLAAALLADIAHAQTAPVAILHFTIKEKSSCADPCVSNVLFVPGMEASRLYMKNPDGSERQVWEPNSLFFQATAKKLYFNPDGTSINDIYTKANGAIDTTAGGDIYSSFLQQLASLKANGTYHDYAVFPYDWRASPSDVVEKGTPYNDGTHYLEPAVEALAASSKTGKVTLVGHSNGGLVIKALMRKLERDGKASLIDKIIFVDVPQTGTPMTIAAMLHGDGESIGLPYLPGFIFSQANARGLGENMPDGFALLPSAAYFAHVATPVIDLSGSPILQLTSGISTTSITSESDLEKFMTGAGARQKPSYSDIEAPNVLSAPLFDSAIALHDNLDAWQPPAGVNVIQIAGWGLDTPSGVTYSEHQVTACGGNSCTPVDVIRHSVNFTEDGDDTVVTPSEAAMGSWPTYYVAIRAFNKSFGTKFGHATAMETQAFQSLFSSLLSSSTPSELPPFVTIIKPTPESLSKSLRLRVLSPVTFDAYDSAGRHTGLAPNPNPQSDLEYVEEQIPGSYYQRYGEGQYIGLPAEGDYAIVMRGTDNGTFTFDETSVVGGVEQKTISYQDIPVTSSTTATISILSSTSQPTLSLDYDGNGTPDAALGASASTDPLSYAVLTRNAIESMDVGKNVKKHIEDILSHTEHDLQNSHKKTNNDLLHNLEDGEKYLQDRMKAHKQTENDRLSAAQVGAIIEMIEKLKNLITI